MVPSYDAGIDLDAAPRSSSIHPILSYIHPLNAPSDWTEAGTDWENGEEILYHGVGNLPA